MASDFTILASGIRTVTGNSADIDMDEIGVVLFLSITAASGTTPTLDISLQGKDPTSGTYIAITAATFAQKTVVGDDMLIVFPGVNNTVNSRISTALPNVWRVRYVVAGTTPSFTFSVGASSIGYAP